MEYKKLLALAKQLNELKDKDGNLLIAKKIKVVAIKEPALIAAFLEACNSIDEAKEELIHDEIADAYNELIKTSGQEQIAKAEEIKVVKENKVQSNSKKKSTDITIKNKDKIIKDKNIVIKSKEVEQDKIKAEKKDKPRDEFGFIIGSVKSNFIKSIKKMSGTMNEICSREWNISKKMQGGYFKEFEKMGLVKREKGIISFIG